jgi:4-amino-4-deoxy-L-arabinose transferase-like glycosyltransferase
VGFLPLLVLLPFFALRGFGWRGLAVIDGGALGWRWWLAPIALLLAIALWFVPMLLAVKMSGSADYAAYRDEILFHQTVGRYAASWHHVKGWWYFLVEVVPPLWIPWSLLLFWLVPRYRAAWQARDARVWLPLLWVLLVLVFFSISPGKRGVYIVPALPALALASLPFMSEILARPGVRRLGWALALLLFGFIALCRRFRDRVAARAARRVAGGHGCAGRVVLVFHRARHECRTLGQWLRALHAQRGEAGRAAGAGCIQGAVPAVPRSSDREFWSSALDGGIAGGV